MFSTNWLFTITIVVLVIIIFLIVVFVTEKYVVPQASVRNKRRVSELHEFQTNVWYDPYPKPRTVENRRDCNVHTLQKCSMSDETSVFGCRKLTVRCHHFDKDTPFVNYNEITGENESVTVPKNSTADEGYALAITNLDQACNAYDGDLVLVAKQLPDVAVPDSYSEYMFICMCKNNDYIGNDDILGNCTTVRVCNGKVENIDVSLRRMKCVCSEYEESYSFKLNNTFTPRCRSLTVRTANRMHQDWSFLVPWRSKTQTLSINKFHEKIVQNAGTTKLLDPCVHDIRDANVIVPGARFDSVLGTCVVDGYGIPVRTNTLRSNGKDSDSIGVKFGNLDSIDGVLNTGPYEKIRILDNVSNYRQMGAITANINFNIKAGRFTATMQPEALLTVALPPNTSFGNPGHIRMSETIAKRLQAPHCVPFIYSYSCKITETLKEISKQNIPVPFVDEPPVAFLWGTDNWVEAYNMYKQGVIENGFGLELVNSQLDKYGNTVKFYGYQIVPESNGFVGFVDVENYKFASGSRT